MPPAPLAPPPPPPSHLRLAAPADWTQYLMADLLDFNGTAAQKALVMGGGA